MTKKIATIAMVGVLSLPLFAKEFVTIGTGGVTGVYYPLGGSICRLVNKGKKEHGVRCSVESTGGSVYNINTIKAGELDMGVAQSDAQYLAYTGTGKFKVEGAYKGLRSVFSVYGEAFAVVARADSGIKTFADLKGKRVNIGNFGSGSRNTMDMLMPALGWNYKSFKVAGELKSSEMSKALCDNKLDAIIFVSGQPNGTMKEATTTCDSIIVDVSGDDINKFISDKPYFGSMTIPGGMYKGTDTDTKTFGMLATFVTSSKISEKVIYNVVKAVFENFETFKKLHPAFANLNKKDMIKNGLSAPLHRGAIKYYKEAGLL